MNEERNLSKMIAEIQSQQKRNMGLIGAGGVIFDLATDRLLVVKGTAKWSLPKGHLDHGEQPNETAMREIFEETSLKVTINPDLRSKKLRKYLYYFMILENAGQFVLAPLDLQE